jgi:hypothetical protein
MHKHWKAPRKTLGALRKNAERHEDETMETARTGSLWRIASTRMPTRWDCETAATPHSFHYLRTKKEKMGHTLTFPHHAGSREGESACIHL